jgi:hypothetical protein
VTLNRAKMSNSYDDKITRVNDDVVETNSHEQGEAHMTKAKWLACFALGLSYTTAFQQGACLGAIVKSIDEALGSLHLNTKNNVC